MRALLPSLPCGGLVRLVWPGLRPVLERRGQVPPGAPGPCRVSRYLDPRLSVAAVM